ncbi:MAG TPA: hypothetical protein VN224_01235 [Xanthomonadales bacterium]|nr:hypothetical protein [Xanthomonadales bacterium]
MNLVILIVSAFLALSAAANVGSPNLQSVSSSAGVTAVPAATPAPSPAPPKYDVIGAGGPT